MGMGISMMLGGANKEMDNALDRKKLRLGNTALEQQNEHNAVMNPMIQQTKQLYLKGMERKDDLEKQFHDLNIEQAELTYKAKGAELHNRFFEAEHEKTGLMYKAWKAGNPDMVVRMANADPGNGITTADKVLQDGDILYLIDKAGQKLSNPDNGEIAEISLSALEEMFGDKPEYHFLAGADDQYAINKRNPNEQIKLNTGIKPGGKDGGVGWGYKKAYEEKTKELDFRKKMKATGMDASGMKHMSAEELAANDVEIARLEADLNDMNQHRAKYANTPQQEARLSLPPSDALDQKYMDLAETQLNSERGSSTIANHMFGGDGTRGNDFNPLNNPSTEEIKALAWELQDADHKAAQVPTGRMQLGGGSVQPVQSYTLTPSLQAIKFLRKNDSPSNRQQFIQRYGALPEEFK